MVCRSKTGSINPCGFAPPHVSGQSQCSTSFDCGIDATGGSNDVPCCVNLYHNNTINCCFGEGTGGPVSASIDFAAPVYRTSPADLFDVKISCTTTGGNADPQSFPPCPNTCALCDWNLSGVFTLADMYSTLMSAFAGFAWPAFGAASDVPDCAISPCSVCSSQTFHGDCFRTDLQLITSQYQFKFAASGVNRTLNWIVRYFPESGAPSNTPMSEAIPAGATQSSIHDLLPPTPGSSSGTAENCVCNAAFS